MLWLDFTPCLVTQLMMLAFHSGTQNLACAARNTTVHWRQDAKETSCTCLVANLSLQHILGAGSDITHRRNPQLLQLLADVPSNAWQLIYLQIQQIRIHLSNARSLRTLSHITEWGGLNQNINQTDLRSLLPHQSRWAY